MRTVLLALLGLLTLPHAARAEGRLRVIVETDKPYDLQLFALRPVFETPA